MNFCTHRKKQTVCGGRIATVSAWCYVGRLKTTRICSQCGKRQARRLLSFFGWSKSMWRSVK